jgi:hypothetical protein
MDEAAVSEEEEVVEYPLFEGPLTGGRTVAVDSEEEGELTSTLPPRSACS